MGLILAFVSPSAAQTINAPVVRHVVAGEGSLTVAWSPPANAGAIVAYDIRYINSSSTSKNVDANWTVVRDVGVGRDRHAVVQGLTNGTSYDIAVRARTSGLTSGWSTAIAGVPDDPGSTASAAATVYSGVPLHVELSSIEDVDFFKFTVAKNSEYIVWSTGDTDTLVELTRSDGTSHVPLISHNNWGVEPGPNNFMMFGSLKPGTYYFKVTSGLWESRSTVLWQGTGPYAFHLHLSDDSSSNEDARTVALGSRVSGVLEKFPAHYPIGPKDIRVPLSNPDTDVFELVIPTATTIAAHLEFGFGIEGKIVNSAGKVMAAQYSGFLEPAYDDEKMVLRASLEAGTYYIHLTQSVHVLQDLDILHIDYFDQPYFLYVNESPESAASHASAVTLAPHAVAGGTASHTSDSLLRIVLQERTPIELRGSSEIDEMTIELQDQDGDPLDISVYTDTRDRGFFSRLPVVHTFSIIDVFEAGTYFLNVQYNSPQKTGNFLALLHEDFRYSRLTRQCPDGDLGIGDDLHGCQWNLRNRGQFGGVSGEDVNLGSAWTTTKGKGVTVAVVDQGIDYLHPDLRENFDMSISGSAFGAPAEALLNEGDVSHGTQVAGIIAARDNEVGVVGVAPRTTISAYQILDSDGVLTTNMAEVIKGLSLHAGKISIRNHSWSPKFLVPKRLPAAITAAMAASRTTGDSGLGTLQVWAVGNQGQTFGYTSNNYFLNDRSGVAVCGVDGQGGHAAYSDQGPNLWVCGPTQDEDRVGITTTIYPSGYSQTFNGTSAATPIVSGVAALVRAANRKLSWRDTKLILADSARQVSKADSGWDDGAAKYSDPSQSYAFSHKFGFGAVDADRAVTLAKNWTPLPAEMSVSATQNTAFEVEDVQSTAKESQLTIGGSVSFVEHVEISLDVVSLFFRQLDIELMSPSGTVSKLSVPYRCQFGDPCDVFGTLAMSSARHLGEDPRGAWTLRMTDNSRSIIPDSKTMVNSWSLKVYGHERAPVTSKASLSVSPDSVTEGGSFDYTITLDRAPGAGNHVTVNFNTFDGTATAGEDYTPVVAVGPNSVRFDSRETTKTIAVNTLRGPIGHDEPPETLMASLSRAKLYVGADVVGTELTMEPKSVSVTIDDHPNDVAHLWFEADAPGVVKNGERARFVARISNPLASDVDVPYQTALPSQAIDFYGQPVSPAHADDFRAKTSATVTIEAGETAAAFNVRTNDDADDEYEFFEVRPRGTAPPGTTWRPASLGGAAAPVVIEPDDAAGTIYLVADPPAPQEGDTVRLSAHLARGAQTSQPTTVTVTAEGAGGAAAPADFTLTDGELRIPMGQQSSSDDARGSGTITVAEDLEYDPGETITLTGTSNRGGDVLASSLTIANTTPLTAELAFTDPGEDGKVKEGGSVGVTVRLVRALKAGETVDVTLRLPADAPGTILDGTTLVSAGNGEPGFSVISPLADVVTGRHPVTNRAVTVQEMKLRFTGAGAQSGSLTLTLGDDGGAADPKLVVPLRIVAITAVGLDEEAALGVKGILVIAVETEGVQITPVDLEVREGATATYEVLLRSDPGGAVTVNIASEEEAVATVDPSTLTFTSAGPTIWSTAQTVTVTTLQDNDGFDDTVGITHQVSGYGDVTAGPRVRVVVRDDDIPNYEVAADWSLIPSDVTPGESFRLVLVTSGTTAASSDHIRFYNDFAERAVAAGHADIRDYAKGFRAWLSTEHVDGRDNTRTNLGTDGTGHSVYWLNTNSKVAEGNAALYGTGTSGWASQGTDERGSAVPGTTTAWWGSEPDGTSSTGLHVKDKGNIRLTDIGNPTDAIDPNDAISDISSAKSRNRVLAISPIFKTKPEVTIVAESTSLTEGDDAEFTVSSSLELSSDLKVNLIVGDGTGSDFVDDGARTVTISSGEDSATFTLKTISDNGDEPNGFVAVQVQSGDGYSVGFPSTALVFVTDDDESPTAVSLSVDDTSVAEDDGATLITVTATVQGDNRFGGSTRLVGQVL